MKIYTLGGYEKVGGNMTAIESKGEIVLLDMGADIERLVEHEENVEELKTVEAIETRIVPDDSKIKNKHREKVVGIVVGHGHQDHCRGVPKLAGAYDCPIYASPYTADIIERFIEEDEENVTNKIIRLEPGETVQISDKIELDFIPITHSIPHAALSFLRTEEGNVLYSLDFKLDDEPTLGEPVDYEMLREIGEEGIRVYIVDSTRVDEPGKSKSEKSTKEDLERLMSETYDRQGIIITTFSSHIARLNNIIEANDGKRKILMIGRSLREYTKDAAKNNLIDLSKVRVASYRNEVEEVLKTAACSKSEYLLITTGNQGEPNAMLSKIAQDGYPYKIGEEDMVIFSSVTIPTSVNQMNREYLVRTLRQTGAEIFEDVHSHGHGQREDHRQMIKFLKPENVIPAHGGAEKLSACAALARKEGVNSVKVSGNGGVLSIK